jgi:mRNA interferase MazF
MYPVNVLVPKGEAGLQKDSVVLCEQIRTVDESRFGKVHGQLRPATMKKIDAALRISLAL